jgi:hypothetical protein
MHLHVDNEFVCTPCFSHFTGSKPQTLAIGRARASAQGVLQLSTRAVRVKQSSTVAGLPRLPASCRGGRPQVPVPGHAARLRLRGCVLRATRGSPAGRAAAASCTLSPGAGSRASPAAPRRRTSNAVLCCPTRCQLHLFWTTRNRAKAAPITAVMLMDVVWL